MKPDTEYAARHLAQLVLADDGRPRIGAAGAAMPVRATVEIEGMVRGIRREILLDHAEIAQHVGDAIEQAASELSIAERVNRAVKHEMDIIGRDLDGLVERLARDMVKQEIEHRLRHHAEKMAEHAIAGASHRMQEAMRKEWEK